MPAGEDAPAVEAAPLGVEAVRDEGVSGGGDAVVEGAVVRDGTGEPPCKLTQRGVSPQPLTNMYAVPSSPCNC